MQPTAREIAVRALGDRAGNVTASLRRLLGQHDLSPADRALARQLALGVVRRCRTLQAVLRAFLAQPDKHLPRRLREILQVGLYQILLLDRVPDFAAVNEAVALAASLYGPRRAGLVNGVLRNIVRELSPTESGPVPFRPEAIPLGAGRYRVIGRPVFADPQQEPARYLAEAYSLPDALVARWLEQTGSPAAVAAWATHANTPAPLIARVNRLRADRSAVLESLAEAQIPAQPHANGHSIVLEPHRDIGELPVVRDGWIQPQDPAATDVVLAAGPRPGMKVLDFCAAPGTKTTHLGELMNNDGHIVAVDVSKAKLQLIAESCDRMGVTIVGTLMADKLGSLESADFDLVLADVPCSNTGVLSRRAEARWRFDPTRLGRLVKDQKAILAAAAHFVRPGGRLVYSTCSMEPQECHDLATHAERRGLGLSLQTEKLIRPRGAGEATQWHDGGYYAIFTRR